MDRKRNGTNPEFAADTDEGQLLGVDTRCVSRLRKEFLNKTITADSHQLFQRGMKGIVVLVQESNLINIHVGIGKGREGEWKEDKKKTERGEDRRRTFALTPCKHAWPIG